MQMLNKYLLILLLSGCINNTAHSYADISLISIVQNVQKENSIFLNNIFQQTRAFDVTTGSSASTITTVNISSTGLDMKAQSCDWHPTGKWFTSIGYDSPRGAIYDVSAAGTAFYHINPQNTISYGDLLYSTRWHPSGNYLAYAGDTAGGIQGRVVFFDTKTGFQSLLTSSANIILGATAQAIAWSPNGKYLAVSGFGTSNVDHVKTFSFDGYALWRLPNSTITYASDPTGNIEALDWHPSGKYLAIGGTSASATAIDTQIYYFNQASKSMHLLPGCNTTFGGDIRKLHWHPEGNYLAVSGLRNNNINIRIFTFNGFSLTETTSISSSANESTSGCKWSPDGAYLAIGEIETGFGGDQQYLRIYSYLDKKLNEETSYKFFDNLREIAWSPDGRLLGLCGQHVTGGAPSTMIDLMQFTEPIDLLQKKQKKELLKIKKMLAATSAALPALYQTTLSTSALIDSTINYSIESLSTVTSFLVNGITGATQPSFDWHPSKNLIAVSAADNIYVYFYNDIALTLVKTIGTTQPIVTTTPSWDIKFSPNADYLISGGWRDYIHSFDGVNLTQKSSKFDHLFNGIEWDKSGNYIFCCEQRTTPTTTINDPGRLTLYAFNGTSLTKVTSTGDLEYATQMSINYNNRFVAKGGNNGKVNLYAFDPMATNTLSFLTSLNELTTSVSTVLFHPQKDILFVNTDTQIRAFSINGTFTTELIGCLVSAAGAQFLDFDPTGKYLLVSFSDKFIVFKFDGTTLTEVIRYSSGSDLLIGAKWSYDGKKIATLVDIGSTVFLRIIKPNFSALTKSKPNLLPETSQAALSVIFGGASQLISQNSYALVNLSNLNITTSNSIIQPTTLTVNTSNALSGLLVNTSNATELLISNSEAIVSINTLSVANSFVINSVSSLAIQNSQAVITDQTLTINTSNAINGLLVDTSNAVAGLLVSTSNATAELLVTTSYAATNIAPKLTPIDTIDTGPAHIHFNAPTITMSYNVLISTDHQLFVHASGVVNGNGHSITFAKGNGTFFTIDPAITTTFQNVIFKDYNDASVSIGAGSSFIFGQNCRVELGEPQTLLRTWSFGGIAQLNGLGNALTLGTGSRFLSTLVSSSLQLSNLTLLNVRENNIRAANNNAQISFQDVTLNMSADFTYSIGSILINNDVILRGTSIFNYATIMGSTINSASRLTIDQGTTFNYAPAGNFRHLLSLTDSSAILFFNHASLVATATGPRLTTGTLLIDGIMNIQSSAVSEAEAIIFGDENPANDLSIKMMPSSAINLLSGYLNYANAQ